MESYLWVSIENKMASNVKCSLYYEIIVLNNYYVTIVGEAATIQLIK